MNVIFDTSLVLYLPLYELNGSSFVSRDAYGHSGMATGAQWRPCGRYFDGSDDYIDFGYNMNLDITDAITLESWFNSAGLGTHSYIVMRCKDDGNTAQYGLGLSDYGKPFVYIENTSWWLSAPALNSGQWYHLVATFHSPDWKIYLNGVLIDSQSSARTLTSQDYRTTIGCRDHWGGQATFFDGLLGEVRVYRWALSPLEIQRNYLATKWRYQ